VFRKQETVKAIKMSAGEQLKLRCHARGIPRPRIKWRKNNVKLSRVDRQHRRRISKWTLSLTSVTQADSGIYKCFVWNQHGNISKTFFVQVKGKMIRSTEKAFITWLCCSPRRMNILFLPVQTRSDTY
jgi:hypothetical protein